MASKGAGLRVARNHSTSSTTATSSPNLKAATPSEPAMQRLQCVGLTEQLAALNLQGRAIDLLSIDIEGSEADALRCVPWAELDVRVVLIETEV